MEQITFSAPLPATGLEPVSAAPTGVDGGSDFAVILEAGLQVPAPAAPELEAVPDVEGLPVDSAAVGINGLIATFATLPAAGARIDPATPAVHDDIPLETGEVDGPAPRDSAIPSRSAPAHAAAMAATAATASAGEHGLPAMDSPGRSMQTPGLQRIGQAGEAPGEGDARTKAGTEPPGIAHAADVIASSRMTNGGDSVAPPAHALVAAAIMAAPQPALQPVAAPARLDVATPFSATSWGTDFSQQVVLMATGHLQVAELRLNPPDLGPVEIRLAISAETGQEANVQFVSAHAPVREAIEASLPRLREMLAEAGVALGQTTVGSEFAGGEKSNAHHEPPGNRAEGRNSAPGATPLQMPARILARRLIDIFA